MAQWFYIRDGQKLGPVNTATLKRLASEGELDPADLIRRDGLPQWVPASEAKGLFPSPVPVAGPSQHAASTAAKASRYAHKADESADTVTELASAQSPGRHSSVASAVTSDASDGPLTPNEKRLLWGGIGGAVLLIAIFSLYFFVIRDTWEADHRSEIIQLSQDSVTLSRGKNPADALKQHDELVRLIGKRTLVSPDLARAVTDARNAVEPERRKLREKEAMATVRDLQSQAKAFASSGDLQAESDKYRQALELIRQTAAGGPEMATATSEITQAKQAVDAKLSEAQRQREAEERAKAELARRAATYSAYAEKTQPFFDSVLRTKSDLEVGVNYRDFGSRVQDMNFRYNKWVASLNEFEKTYPSALVLERALDAYTRSQQHWSADFRSDASSYPSYYYSDSMRQFEWVVAGRCLKLAALMMDKKDVFPSIDCSGCEGLGVVKCPHCEGKKACPTCKGTSHEVLYLLREGGFCCRAKNVCQVCGGSGLRVCAMCGGTKKTPGQ
jgi:hypothetical protein